MKIFTHHFYLLQICLAFLLFLPALNATSQIYKWTDKNGKVHYSDKPIDDKSKLIVMKREPTSTEIIQAQERASALIKHKNKVQEIADDERQEQQKTIAENNKKEKKLSALCRQAKREIRILGKGRVTYTTDEEGKRHYLSDDEKNQNIAKLQKNIEEHCEK